MSFKKCVLKKFYVRVCRPPVGTIVIDALRCNPLPPGLKYLMLPSDIVGEDVKRSLSVLVTSGLGAYRVTTEGQFVMQGVLGEYSVLSFTELQSLYLMESDQPITSNDLAGKLLKDGTIPWFRVRSNPSSNAAMSAIFFTSQYTGYSNRFGYSYTDTANIAGDHGCFRITTDDGLSSWCEPAELFKAKYNNRGWSEELLTVPTLKPIESKLPRIGVSKSWVTDLAAHLLPDLYQDPNIDEYSVSSDSSSFEFKSKSFLLSWNSAGVMEVRCPGGESSGVHTPITLKIKYPFKKNVTESDLHSITARFKKVMKQLFSCSEGLLVLQRNIQKLYRFNIMSIKPHETGDLVGFSYNGAVVVMKPKEWFPDELEFAGNRVGKLTLDVDFSGKLVVCKSCNLINATNQVVEHKAMLGHTLDEFRSMELKAIKSLMEDGIINAG